MQDKLYRYFTQIHGAKMNEEDRNNFQTYYVEEILKISIWEVIITCRFTDAVKETQRTFDSYKDEVDSLSPRRKDR